MLLLESELMLITQVELCYVSGQLHSLSPSLSHQVHFCIVQMCHLALLVESHLNSIIRLGNSDFPVLIVTLTVTLTTGL